jgi:F-type H+/Na+-transporting ATPase subunit beta
MNNTANSFPVGTQILGRVLNSNGEPIDKKGPLVDVQYAPLYSPALVIADTEANKGEVLAGQIQETGIKVIDLLAPLPRGGVVGVFGNAGTGKLVVTEELIHNLSARHNGYIVCLSMDESSYEVGELMDLIREGEFEDRAVMIFEQMTDSLEVRQRMIWAGFTIVEHFQQQGYKVLLVLEKNMTAIDGKAIIQIGELRQMLEKTEITAIMLGAEEDTKKIQVGNMPGDLDCQIVLTRKMADQSLWPAIDRFSSKSRLLNSEAAGYEHVQVAEQIREILLRYTEFETLEQQELSDTDKQVLRRAQRIQKFLTQPFFVAEAYTDIPGEYVEIAETVSGFKDLLAGRYDDLPEQAFYFVGRIDEAIEKAKSNREQG